MMMVILGCSIRYIVCTVPQHVLEMGLYWLIKQWLTILNSFLPLCPLQCF